MGGRFGWTALLVHVFVAPAAGDAELQHLEGTVSRMNVLGEVTRTPLGTFRLDSGGPGDLRENPGTAEISLFSGGCFEGRVGWSARPVR
jgi:hypothetical protein